MNTHELKCWPPFFQAILTGVKTFDVRNNDRGFQVGDIVRLCEWERAETSLLGGYTGRSMDRRVVYILAGGQFGLESGYVVLGLGAV